MLSRMAYLTARWQISVISAPEKPWVTLDSRSMSTSGATGDLRSALLKMERREPSSAGRAGWGKRGVGEEGAGAGGYWGLMETGGS